MEMTHCRTAKKVSGLASVIYQRRHTGFRKIKKNNGFLSLSDIQIFQTIEKQRHVQIQGR